MARFRIRLGRDLGALRSTGVGDVQVSTKVGVGVRAAVAELLLVAQSDPELSADQSVLVRNRTHVLEAETVKKRWNKERLRELLADIAQFAGTAKATGNAIEAVREALAPVVS